MWEDLAPLGLRVGVKEPGGRGVGSKAGAFPPSVSVHVLLCHSLIHTLIPSLTNSFTDSLIHSLSHSLIHSLIHSFIQEWVVRCRVWTTHFAGYRKHKLMC